MSAWKNDAATPSEARAARLFEAAARLEVPPPPDFSTLEASSRATTLVRRALLKKVAAVVVTVGLAWQAGRLMQKTTKVVEQPAPPAPPMVSAPKLAPPAPMEVEVVAPTPAPVRAEPRPRIAKTAPAQPPPAAPTSSKPSTLGEEAALLAVAVRALRNDKDPVQALSLLRDYHSRFPEGILQPEALLAEAQAERALHHLEAALALLEKVGPVVEQKLAAELDVTRGELLSELGRCEAAESAFSAALATSIRGQVEERGAWGRAACAARRSAPDAVTRLRAFIIEHPDSTHLSEALELLNSAPPRSPPP